jgi:hypothetical protein
MIATPISRRAIHLLNQRYDWGEHDYSKLLPMVINSPSPESQNSKEFIILSFLIGLEAAAFITDFTAQALTGNMLVGNSHLLGDGLRVRAPLFDILAGRLPFFGAKWIIESHGN